MKLLKSPHLLYSCLESAAAVTRVWAIWLSRVDEAAWSLRVERSVWEISVQRSSECFELPCFSTGEQFFKFVQSHCIAERQDLFENDAWQYILESLEPIDEALAGQVRDRLAEGGGREWTGLRILEHR